jgi:hypothetical protein
MQGTELHRGFVLQNEDSCISITTYVGLVVRKEVK